MKNFYWILFCLILSISSCKKDEIFIDDNTPIDGKYISTIQIQNYVNRIFLDLIGREPLLEEMEMNVQYLKDNTLSLDSRRFIIDNLQTDETVLAQDSSYKIAYYYRLYELAKSRMIEGVENDFLAEERGVLTNALNAAVSSGDSAQAAFLRDQIKEINDVFAIPRDYRNDSITINTVFYRMLDNFVYDIINMNTFNFVNASYDDLFFRFPTQQEYNIAFNMIENNESGVVLGMSGNNRDDFMNIVTQSSQFYEGLIVWTYKSLLQRNPNAAEIQKHMLYLPNTKNFQELQIQIMITDEYANF